jgi:hypothetical protein
MAYNRPPHLTLAGLDRSVNATTHEHGITGRRAAQAALVKLQTAIEEAPEFRQ